MRTARPAKNPKPKRHWRLVWKETGQPAMGSDVEAHTRSEARSLFNKEWGRFGFPSKAMVIEVQS